MNRSVFFHNMAFGAIGATILQKQALASLTEPAPIWNHFYAGCYTTPPQEGIPVCRFDPDNGTIQLVDVCRGIDNPSFLIFDHQRKFVYAVNETADFNGQSSGAVSAFRRDEKTGKLTFLNAQPSLGAHPCHLSMDRTGKFILVANYTGGNVAVLSIKTDGHLDEPVDMVQHTGSGLNSSRQQTPHAHSVNLSPDNRFAFVCDLGIDRIMIYQFDQNNGKLSAAARPWFQCAPGSGPRHFTFSPDGNHACVINELHSTLTYFSYDQESAVLTESHTITTLPDDFTAENTGADIHIHPNGKFVYASNRGHDSIAVFSVNQESGHLKLVQHQSTLGKTPRNFAIHPSGRFLLAANQDSNSVCVFSLDLATGRLGETGKSIMINKPVCILL